MQVRARQKYHAQEVCIYIFNMQYRLRFIDILILSDIL